VNVRDRRGQTPLHLAASTSDPVVVMALLACGANPRIRDDEGRTAWDVADGRDGEVIRALLEVALANDRE